VPATLVEDTCIEQNVGRRRVFWTTQPQACDSYTLCGAECVIPGLEYETFTTPYVDQRPDSKIYPPSEGSLIGYRTIKTTGWLTSLILNILNTRSRSDLKCPTPAAVYGHWSESYRDDGLYVGSTLWNAASKPYPRTSDAVKAIQAAVRADMNKLVAMGIAESVDVEARYLGAGNVGVTVTVHTMTGRSKISLSGTFVSESWEWR
jgi:phage gp46-like protein